MGDAQHPLIRVVAKKLPNSNHFMVIDNGSGMDSCDLELSGQVGRSFDTKESNLTAKCVFRWINIDVK